MNYKNNRNRIIFTDIQQRNSINLYLMCLWKFSFQRFKLNSNFCINLKKTYKFWQLLGLVEFHIKAKVKRRSMLCYKYMQLN